VRPSTLAFTKPLAFTLLRDIVEVGDGRLNRKERGRLAWRTWQDERGACLIRALDEPDRELRPQGHGGSTPRLASGRIAKIIRLEVLARRIEKALCSLVVDVETPPWKSDQRRHAAVERPHT